MTKKNILKVFILLLISFIAYQSYIFFIPQDDNLQGIYLVPKDAVFIVETQKPIDTWDEISKSDVWKHLQTNAYFKDLTSNLNQLDGVFHEKKKIFDIIGNRSTLISVHMISKKKYGMLFTVDLQKISRLNILKNNIGKFVSKNFKFSKRKYHNFTINEIYDKKSRETLYITFIKNQLVASYTHTLVEASIDQHLEPIIGRDLNFIEVKKKVRNDDLFRLFIQYKYLDDYMYYFSNKPTETVKLISNTLLFSGFSFDFKNENTIYANGFTNTNESTSNYLKALQKSGKGIRTIDKIAPKRTAIYMSFAFDSFSEFYTNFEEVQKENTKSFKTYQNNLDKVQNFLNIDLKKNFIHWMGSEIAILQMQSAKYSNLKNETALVIKAKDIKNAKKNLSYVLKQIKKRTPVKFKTIEYNKHEINYLSIKGFFKMFLGNFFNEFDKPYFTYIDDYVVFSNYPSTLKNIIDDYENNEILIIAKDYEKFKSNFEKKSSVCTYINTATLYKSLYKIADNNTKLKLQKNKDYIICFPQIGFQLSPYSNMFESTFVINYQDPEIVKNKAQFKEITVEKEPKANQTNETNNLLNIKKEDLFIVEKIYPKDLDIKEFTTKYKNGKIHVLAKYKNGLKHGKYKEYYPNGKLKLFGRFKNGKQVGTWKAYNANGKLIHKKRF